MDESTIHRDPFDITAEYRLFVIKMALKTLLCVTMICFASSAWLVTSLPAPAHAMMVHGFLLRQPGGGGYAPHGGMTAYASRFYNSRTSLVNENPDAEPPAEEVEVPTPEDTPVEQEAPEDERAPEEAVTKAPAERTPKAERAPAPSKPKAPKPPKRRPAEEDDEEDESDYTPSRRNGGGSTYSNFFPIVFGSRTGVRRSGRAGEEEEALQGGPGLTAIANSFSTGRGAIAASHATAYGGPAPAAPAAPTNQYRKGSPSRYRS